MNARLDWLTKTLVVWPSSSSGVINEKKSSQRRTQAKG